MHLLDLWIRPNPKRPRSARALRAGISFKIRGRRRPSNLSVVQGVAREGNHIRVATTFVLPHVLETSGDVVPPGDFSFDSTLFKGFSSGLPGVPPGETATVDLFIFDAATGLPMVQPNGQDCGPCAFTLDTSRQRQLVRLDDIFSTHPRTAVPTSVCVGFGVIVSQGAGNDALHGFVVNSPTAPFDVSVFGFAPGRVEAVPQAVNTGGRDAACGRSSTRATQLRRGLRRQRRTTPPPPPPSGSVSATASHRHGTGKSNLCVHVATSPAAGGKTASVNVTGATGFSASKSGTLDVQGRATLVFPITSFDTYSAAVDVGGARGTVSHVVGAGGDSTSCPAP